MYKATLYFSDKDTRRTARRPKIEDLILAIERANTLEGNGDLREARDELEQCRYVLGEEINRIIQAMRQLT